MTSAPVLSRKIIETTLERYPSGRGGLVDARHDAIE